MAESQNSSQLLVKKPRAVSFVWNYFGLRTEGGRVVHDNEPFFSNLSQRSFSKRRNTSSLMAHLREHHTNLHTEAMALNHQQQVSGSCSGRSTNGGDNTQTTVTELFEASRKFHPISPQAVELYLSKDAQPFYTKCQILFSNN